MKTILVNHLFEPPNRITGITRFLFSILSSLVQRGTYNYVLATSWTAQQLPISLKTTALTVVPHRFIESLPLSLLNQSKSLPKLCRKFEVDLEFSCNPIGLPIPSRPRILTVHDMYLETLPEQYSWRPKLWWSLFFGLGIRTSEMVVCVSNSTRNELESRHRISLGKCVTIHEASALGHYSRDPQAGRDAFGLFVGNISPNKNISLLLSALTCISANACKIKVVGRDDAGILAKAISEQRASGIVDIVGSIEDHILDRLYQRARFLVVTSLQEGFCLPIVEAQERGTPIVCPDAPIFREVAGDGALYYKPKCPMDLADKLCTISNNNDVFTKISELAEANSKRFSWARSAERLEAVFASVSSASRSTFRYLR